MISIVDDDEPLRKAIKGLVRALGFVAVDFASAAEFLNFDGLHRTGCLIADVQMPGMTGLELHKRLVASGFSIPTILMTAYPDESMRARALEAGIICYLTKPFDKDILLSCIRPALDRAKTKKK
jgi:FixJ family two-component response regulator